MPLAPTSEQHRIVAAIEEQFSRLDAGAESLERVRRNLGRIRSSVLKDAVEGRLTQQYSEDESAELLLKRVTDARTPPKHKELPGFDLATLPSLPSGWVWCRAWQVCDLITNGDTPAADKMSSGEGEIPFIKIYNLTANGLLDFETRPTFISRETHLRELRRSRIVPGDVLINIVGPPLGKVARVPSLHSEWNTNQAVVLFRPSEAIDSRLLMLWLMSNPIMDRLTATSKATAGQYNVALSACRLLPMPLPPIAEQERIVTEVERLLTVVSDVDAAVATAHLRREALRRAILASAFEGRLVPQDSSDEPASTLLDRIRDQSLLSGANASGSSRRPRKTR
jgi:type I restriction enzyme S subunit